MKPTHLLVLSMLSLALGAPALAQQQKANDHAAHHPPAATTTTTTTTAAAADLTDGEVRKVDKEAGKLTLKHGEIKSLDMPPMTMVFAVKDKAMLDKLKAGDKVRFKAVSDGGKYLVTEIRPVP